MANIKELCITEIEALKESEAAAMAESVETIKDHTIYFCDIPGYFGYSALVFCEGKHIYYSNDYELHHPGKTHEELKAWYVQAMNNKLFTEDELAEPIKDYDEYTRKNHFLRDYYDMRRDYISIFFIGSDQEREAIRKKTETMIYNPVSFCYMNDQDFVNKCVQLSAVLEKKREECEKGYSYMKDAIKREMANHEYFINWQGDYDVLSCFCNGRLKPKCDQEGELESYFKQCGFSTIQMKAYIDARNEYLKEAREIDY